MLTSFCGLLERDIGGELPERARRDMDFISDAARRMKRLIHDLLALSARRPHGDEAEGDFSR